MCSPTASSRGTPPGGTAGPAARRRPPSAACRGWPAAGRGRRQYRGDGGSGRLFGEVFVGELDGDGALADGGGDALDGPVAHVTGREDAGQAGFEEQRRARQRPSGGRPRGAQVTPGQHV